MKLTRRKFLKILTVLTAATLAPIAMAKKKKSIGGTISSITLDGKEFKVGQAPIVSRTLGSTTPKQIILTQEQADDLYGGHSEFYDVVRKAVAEANNIPLDLLKTPVDPRL